MWWGEVEWGGVGWGLFRGAARRARRGLSATLKADRQSRRPEARGGRVRAAACRPGAWRLEARRPGGLVARMPDSLAQ